MVVSIHHPIELTSKDWQRILTLGSEQRARELTSELVKAEKAIAQFETRFGMKFASLEESGLPADADLETHEAYIEWHSWESRVKDLHHRLKTLQNLKPENA